MARERLRNALDPRLFARPGLLLFAKAPVPGAVKRRLVPALGAARAARLQAALIERTVATALAFGGAALELWCAPDCSDPAFAALAERAPLTLHAQPPGDLGTRMHAALAAALSRYDAAVLVGCDCPPLDAAHLAAAYAALAAHDAVLGPAEDGGYMLIGLKKTSPVLFDGIAWGGPRVLVDTRRRLVALGWRWHELPPLWDLDRPDDLARLAEVGLAVD